MKRLAAAGGSTFLLILAGYWMQQRTKTAGLESTKETNIALARLAQRVALPESIEAFNRAHGRGWQQSIGNLTAGTASPKDQFDIQRFVSDTFKPVPITATGLKAILVQPPNPLVPDLTDAESAELRNKARSVGRLLTRTCPGDTEGCFSFLGTLFMVNEQIAVTNCHVIKKFVSKSDGQWGIKPDRELFADFSDRRQIKPAEGFRVMSLVGCSEAVGFDVAMIRLAAKALNGVLHLPPPLAIDRQPLQRAWDTLDTRVYVIGYPNWSNTLEPDLKTLAAAGDFSRMASPGVLSQPLPQGGFHFLPHNSSTIDGNSGSPVIDMKTFQVVGIHSCCSKSATESDIAELPCATVFGNLTRNLALPTWYVATDSQLKGFLP